MGAAGGGATLPHEKSDKINWSTEEKGRDEQERLAETLGALAQKRKALKASGAEKKSKGEAKRKAKGKILLKFPPVAPNQKSTVRWTNPKKEGFKSWHRHEKYKHAKTKQEYRHLGGTTGNSNFDGQRGYIHVHRHGQPNPPAGFGPGESAANAALDNWCAANPLLSKGHLKERELLETSACRAYSAKSLEWWEERVNSEWPVAGPEGARALERMLPCAP